MSLYDAVADNLWSDIYLPNFPILYLVSLEFPFTFSGRCFKGLLEQMQKPASRDFPRTETDQMVRLYLAVDNAA